VVTQDQGQRSNYSLKDLCMQKVVDGKVAEYKADLNRVLGLLIKIHTFT